MMAGGAQHQHILHSIAVRLSDVEQMMQGASLVDRFATYLAAVAGEL